MKAYSHRKKISVLLMAAVFTLSSGVGCGKENKKAEKKEYLSSADKYFKNGKYAESVIEYKNALKYTPKSSTVNYKLFKAYLKQKNVKEAFPFLITSLKYAPDNRDARFSLAEILLLAKKYDNAIKEVEKLLKSKPNDWRALNIKATCLSLKRNFNKALPLFKKSIKNAPKEFSPYIGAARVLIYLDKADEALKMLESAEKIKPKDVSISLLKAEYYKKKNDLSSMEKELISVTKRFPKTTSAFVALAKYYTSIKKTVKARDIIAQAIKNTPNNTEINMMDARLSFMLNKTDEALKKYSNFIKKNPNDYRVVNEYITLLSRLDKFGEAEAVVDKFERLNINSSPRERLGQLMMLNGKDVDSEKQFNKAIKLNKKSAVSYYSLSEIYMKRSELDKAKKFLDKGLTYEPDSINANVLLSKIYLLKRENDKARKEILILRKKRPNSSVTLNLEARLAMAERNDFVTAEKKLNKSIKLNPKNPKTLYLLGNVLAGKKDWNGAERTFKKLVEIIPSHLGALRGLVKIYYKNGKGGKALKLISGLVKKYPNNYDFKVLLAKIYYRKKNKKKSIELLRAAKAIKPKLPTAYKLLAGIFVSVGKNDEALEEYRYVLKHNPDSYITLLKYIDLIRKYKGNAAAEAEGEKFYKENKSRKGVSEVLGRLKLDEGKLDEARKYFNEALENDSKSVPAYYSLGEMALGLREIASAKKYFSKVIELSPRNMRASEKLGQIYVEEGNLVGAEKMLKVIKEQASGSTVALNLEAYINMTKGNFDAAEKGLNKSIAKDSKNYRTIYTLARLFMAKREWNKALKAFLSIQKIVKVHIPTIMGVTESYNAMGQHDKGIKFISDIVSKNQNNYKLKIILARAYHTAKKDEKAIDVLNKARALKPKLLIAPSLLTRILILNKKYEEAKKELLSMLVDHPRYIPALLELGKIAEMNDGQKASEYYKKVLEISPKNVMALNNYAWILAEKGERLGKAMEYAQTAKSKSPKSLPVTDTLGWVYLKKNIYTLAISNFSTCVNKEPKNPIYNYHLGLAYYKSGDKKNAKKYLNESLKLKKDYDGSKEARKIISNL